MMYLEFPLCSITRRSLSFKTWFGGLFSIVIYLFMIMVAIRLLIRVWSKGGINIVQNDIYYNFDDNLQPENAFKDGLDVQFYFNPVDSNLTYEELSKVLFFKAFLQTTVYNEETEWYEINYQPLQDSD